MLSKLVDYEFAATARWMGPLCFLPLVMAVGAYGTMGWINGPTVENETLSGLLSILGSLVMVGYFLSVAAVFAAVLVLMVQRFRSNLLGDEGYVMFTLPVSTHALVWSKIIVSVVWFVLAILASLISMTILTMYGNIWQMVPEVPRIIGEIRELFGSGRDYGPLVHLGLFMAEWFAAVAVCAVELCLLFYAPLAIGHSFDKNKMLLSVVFFFVIQAAYKVVNGSFLLAVGAEDIMGIAERLLSHASQELLIHGLLWSAILASALSSAVLYAITQYMLRRRLNLE